MPDTQANTPFYLDKSFWLSILGLLLPILNSRFSLGLNAEEVTLALLPLVAFIAGSKWKSGHVLATEIKAKNAIALPEGMTAQEAAFLLAQVQGKR